MKITAHQAAKEDDADVFVTFAKEWWSQQEVKVMMTQSQAVNLAFSILAAVLGKVGR